MIPNHIMSKLFTAQAVKDGASKFGDCTTKRWIAKKSSDDSASTGSNRGSATVANPVMSGPSTYAEDMYKLWLKDKTSVHSSWDRYFSNSQFSDQQSTHSSGPNVSVNQIDKRRLVQFISPKQSNSQANEVSTRQVTIRDDDDPIVIKIDIINERIANDTVSIKSAGGMKAVEIKQPVKQGLPSPPQPHIVNNLDRPATTVIQVEQTGGAPVKSNQWMKAPSDSDQPGQSKTPPKSPTNVKKPERPTAPAIKADQPTGVPPKNDPQKIQQQLSSNQSDQQRALPKPPVFVKRPEKPVAPLKNDPQWKQPPSVSNQSGQQKSPPKPPAAINRPEKPASAVVKANETSGTPFKNDPQKLQPSTVPNQSDPQKISPKPSTVVNRPEKPISPPVKTDKTIGTPIKNDPPRIQPFAASNQSGQQQTSLKPSTVGNKPGKPAAPAVKANETSGTPFKNDPPKVQPLSASKQSGQQQTPPKPYTVVNKPEKPADPAIKADKTIGTPLKNDPQRIQPPSASNQSGQQKPATVVSSPAKPKEDIYKNTPSKTTANWLDSPPVIKSPQQQSPSKPTSTEKSINKSASPKAKEEISSGTPPKSPPKLTHSKIIPLPPVQQKGSTSSAVKSDPKQSSSQEVAPKPPFVNNPKIPVPPAIKTEQSSSTQSKSSPRIIHPPKKSIDSAKSGISAPPKQFESWQQHVDEFMRSYLRPTKENDQRSSKYLQTPSLKTDPIITAVTPKTSSSPNIKVHNSEQKQSNTPVLNRSQSTKNLPVATSVIARTDPKLQMTKTTQATPKPKLGTSTPSQTMSSTIATQNTPNIKVQPGASATNKPPSQNAPISNSAINPGGSGSNPSMNTRSATAAGGGGGVDINVIQQHLAVQGVIRSYQVRGHLITTLDPLGILDREKTTLEQRNGLPPKQITRQHTALEGIDLNTSFQLPETTFVGEGEKSLPLKEIIRRLEQAYGQHIGVEFMYIQDMAKSLWIREKMESPKILAINNDLKIKTLKRLIRAVHFESFLAKKYSSEKRFGLEGGETMIPCIKQIIDTSTDLGVEGININMAHRGRLNVLANVCRKSLKDIFTTFAGLAAVDEGSGDVKYHLGTVTTRENSSNKKKVRLSVVANPSHLEASGPVCLGKTRCEQFMAGDRDGTTIMSIFIHGDAAFCGQGVVYESIHLSNLPCYTTKGTIHIVVNNQVGFTTDPRFSRSSLYSTDVARVVLAPIFHVHGDDPEAVVQVSRIAAEWRQKFREDVVIDIVGYRRNGHNELDEPMFTQPLMYQIIKKHPNIAKIYADKLIKEGLIQQVEVDSYIKEYEDICEKDFARAKDEKQIKYSDWLDCPWKGFFKKYKFNEMPNTGIQEDVLQQIGKAFSTPPPNFTVHRGITRILKGRAKMVEQRMTDWSLGEAFAYASLMKDGYHVRLSGQDVERGTFGHRHHVMHHQTEDKKTFNILENIFPNQAPYSVCNSSLSEFGVLGFEVGYSLVSPYTLCMWEGQFGDFANGGQVVFDQFLSSGQSKWFRQCGLVVQLPHALEGAGPEHSSGRLERFLQMCADDVTSKGPFDEKFVLHQHEHCNWFVANCSTPASLFHLLRRQVLLPFRKPCILMTPKSLLRHPLARSSFDEFLDGRKFIRVLPEAGPASQAPDQVKKLIFCCGHTYYDILEWIAEAKLESQIAVSRTEQLAPFPYDLVSAEINKYKNAKVYWAQEEHRNQGGWYYMHERINGSMENKIACEYLGRAGSASPATGNKQMHLDEIASYKASVIKL